MDNSIPLHDTGHDVLPDVIVEQAVGWYVRLSSGTQTEADNHAFTQWHDADADHARAWQRMQAMTRRVQGSTQYAAPALTRTALMRTNVLATRRAVLKSMAWFGVGTTAVYMAQSALPWQAHLASALADETTATGQQRTLQLADGTQLILNTATAIDIAFNAHERRVVLRHGEIMVATARDTAGRPFIVETAHGTLIPVGTRFSVRRDESAAVGQDMTHIAVTEGAVEIRPAKQVDAQPMLVRAGQQTSFTQDGVLALIPFDSASQSWVSGTVTAEGLRLADFIDELSRYRPGRLRCAPEVADLRITGVWQLNGTDHILTSLERHFPVRIHRMTRYWVTVAAR